MSQVLISHHRVNADACLVETSRHDYALTTPDLVQHGWAAYTGVAALGPGEAASCERLELDEDSRALAKASRRWLDGERAAEPPGLGYRSFEIVAEPRQQPDRSRDCFGFLVQAEREFAVNSANRPDGVLACYVRQQLACVVYSDPERPAGARPVMQPVRCFEAPVRQYLQHVTAVYLAGLPVASAKRARLLAQATDAADPRDFRLWKQQDDRRPDPSTFCWPPGFGFGAH